MFSGHPDIHNCGAFLSRQKSNGCNIEFANMKAGEIHFYDKKENWQISKVCSSGQGK